jgi:hypothetical protein
VIFNLKLIFFIKLVRMNLKIKKKLLFISAFFVTNFGYSQVSETTQTIESLIEEIAETSDEDLDYTSLFDDLFYFSQNPLNLNSAKRETLEKLKFLSDIQIEEILKYRYKTQGFKTIYELQLLNGFETKDIERILSFVKVEEVDKTEFPDLKRVFKYGKQTIFLRTQFFTQQQKGFDPLYEGDKYLGDKYKYYTKYQFDYKRTIQFGFLAEKDPGEQFFEGTQKYGFDYYSAHLFIKNIGKIKSIALGDYKANFGQGLIIWSGLSTSKSSYVNDIRKSDDGLSKYSSSDENLFLRGAGTTLRFGDIDVSVFFSYKNIDANLNSEDTIADEQMATSFQITGLHRTLAENEDRKAVSEMLYGSNIKLRKNNFNLGATFLQYMFGATLNKNPQTYNQFYFNGSSNFNTSIDYNFTYQNFYFFGEEAMSQNGGFALLNGVTVSLASQISISALHRNYQRDYQAYYSAGFGESSGTANEKGLYLGAEINPYKSLKISAYFDSYSFPWLKFGTNAPSFGADYFVQADYSINRFLTMYARYKTETKSENTSLDVLGIKPVVPYTKTQFRYNINYKISSTLSLKNRIELSKYSKEGNITETGFLMFQDISYKHQTLPFTLDFRFAIFDATYNARIYAYETDILYGYSIPAFSGKGIRTYLTLKYTIIPDKIDFWARVAIFSYADTDVLGSGLTEIQGSNKTEVKFQIRIKI